MSYATLDQLLQQLRLEAWLGVMAVSTVLTLLGAYLYLLSPNWNRFQELAADTAPLTLAETEVRAQERTLEIATLEGDLLDVRKALFGGSVEIPPEQMESYVIDRLADLSSRSDLRLIAVKPGDPGSLLMFEELPYDVEVVGSYFALHDWLHAVEDELRPLVVKRFEMRPAARGSEPVAMSVRLVSYRVPEERAS